MKTKNLILIVILAMVSSFFTVAGYNYFANKNQVHVFGVNPTNVKFASLGRSEASPGVTTDFVTAASITTPTVVHITTEITPKRHPSQNYDPFRNFFGGDDFWNFNQPYGNQPQEASGSGVIISDDGYIVTNNHVVADGDAIKVILYNKKTYDAKVIGTDPSTDLALVKIEATSLPYISFGNSDSTKVGEWVLAVGNPFNLESTVTAGIISAKGRNINILKGKGSIESYIQTDAAVNPGNSGGALVNLHGELVGINSAIATPTGSFAGYSFAVPVNLVKKVVNDIAKFGVVQRGYLGVQIADIDSKLSKEKDINTMNGVYVDTVNTGSAAAEAGIRGGDVITAINGVKINSVSELQAQVANYHPGDDVTVTVLRGEKEKNLTARLKNIEGQVTMMKKDESSNFSSLGADFRNLNSKEMKETGLNGGVKVTKLYDGKLTRNTDIKEGFIITKVDNKVINSVDDLKAALQNKTGQGVMIQGTYENYPGSYFYAFQM